LKDYNEFVKEALENYEKLPQETNELYKRHFINIPFDLSSATKLQGNLEDENILSGTIQNGFSKFNIKFDILLTSKGFVSNNEFVKIQKMENVGEGIISKNMYQNKEDKYFSYIHALSKECVFIEVPDGKNEKINILALASNIPLNTIIFLKVGNNSKLNIFEYFGSAASELPSSLGIIHEIDIANDSDVEVNALHNENSNTISLNFSKNRVGDNSHLKINAVYAGALQTRVRNFVEATGKASNVNVNEIVFGSGEQKFDINTYIINKGEHTTASLESKAALMDKSFCILKGFAKIEKGAHNAKSYVHERGINLDPTAKIYGLPDMSVDENDVKATHSSATSPIDPESVFYLMSKGISTDGVRKLLISGFFASSIEKMNDNVMRELSFSLISDKLETRRYGVMPEMTTRNVWVASKSGEEDMFKGHYKYRGT
jgi:Fe-S cluster assembly protein SufD